MSGTRVPCHLPYILAVNTKSSVGHLTDHLTALICAPVPSAGGMTLSPEDAFEMQQSGQHFFLVPTPLAPYRPVVLKPCGCGCGIVIEETHSPPPWA